MTNIIVAFSKIEDAKSIKNVLMRNGFSVVAVCTCGAQALASLDGFNSGILVCGYRFKDMIYKELKNCIPSNIDMLLVASPNKWSGQDVGNIVCLPLPLKVHDLVTTLAMMEEAQKKQRRRLRQQPAKRSDQEQSVINEAKRLLMERNQMTEAEAHRYIQKCSMTSGCNLVETAQMVISLINK